MLERDRGAIITVASTAGFQPVPYMAVYGATKAFVISFTEALWAETRGRMPAERVVHAALRALDRRAPSIIPGVGNWLLANSTRLAPRSFVARIVDRVMQPTKKTEKAPT